VARLDDDDDIDNLEEGVDEVVLVDEAVDVDVVTVVEGVVFVEVETEAV
jgi:hypothetical protein